MVDVEAVSISDLVVDYGDLRAVDGISLCIPQGSICVLLGPNGAGKTTTLNALLGVLRPDHGSVQIFGGDPRDRHVRSQVGVVLQDPGLPVAATPSAIVRHFAAMYSDPLPAPAVLERLGLSDLKRPYRRLSGGEQQRVKLAVALIGRPRVLILDEPTTGMDPAARRAFWTLLDELRDQAVTVLMTTHQPDEVASRVDRVVILHHGHVVADATVPEIIETAPVWFSCARHLDLRSLTQVLGDGFDVAEVEPGRYRVQGDVGVAQISAIRSWVAGHGDGSHEVTVVRSLEEAYLAMTGGQSW